MPLHPYIANALKAGANLPTVYKLPVEAARAQAKARYANTAARFPVADVRDIVIPGGAGEIRARVYTPIGTGRFPLLVFLIIEVIQIILLLIYSQIKHWVFILFVFVLLLTQVLEYNFQDLKSSMNNLLELLR